VKYLVLALLAFTACDEAPADTPDVIATKAQCRKLLAHAVTITPRGAGLDAEQVAAALPVEDIDGCVHTEPEIRDCMLDAPDLDKFRACIPKDEILACMKKAKGVPEIRKKCWSGDPKAAESIKATE
jgi:hypothetical protein